MNERFGSKIISEFLKKIVGRICGWRFVWLIDFEGDKMLRRVFYINDKRYCNPIYPFNRCILLNDDMTTTDTVGGHSYIVKWEYYSDSDKKPSNL